MLNILKYFNDVYDRIWSSLWPLKVPGPGCIIIRLLSHCPSSHRKQHSRLTAFREFPDYSPAFIDASSRVLLTLTAWDVSSICFLSTSYWHSHLNFCSLAGSPYILHPSMLQESIFQIVARELSLGMSLICSSYT